MTILIKNLAGVLVDGMQPAEVALWWASERPAELRMIVETPGEEALAHYTFARALVDAAFCDPTQPHGEGDVSWFLIDERRGCFRVLLADGETYYPLIVEAGPIHDLMIESYMVVPAAGEHRELTDAELAQLFGAQA